MKKYWKRLLSAGLVLAVMITALSGCSGKTAKTDSTDSAKATDSADVQGTENGGNDSEPLEYSFVFYDDEASKWANNPNDVVTPYLEEKFNIKVKEVIVVKSEDFTQRLNQWIAADAVPDVICAGDTAVNYAISTGQFQELDEQIDKMVNYNKYFDQKYWPRFMNDGKRYQIPNVTLNLNAPEYQDDPYNSGDTAWCLWAREDILAQCGYTFTPIDEIAAETVDQGIKPTADNFKIEPAIDTPEKFYELLKKIKDLNLQVEGQDVIPLSITSWQQFHIGSMFDFGHWSIDDSGEVDGYLGAPGAKDYYKFLNKLYNEGLIDKDFVIQKDEQLQEKVASGRVAVGMAVPDLAAAQETMKTLVPDAKLRYIEWPKQEQGKGCYDIYQGGGWRYIISNKVKDVDRLTQYFDWFYSDEGMDLITWGPESAGLWEVKDGKKVFVDPEVEQACLNGETGKRGADYYGLYDPFATRSPFWSKAAMATPVMTHGNPFSYVRSYPAKLNIFEVANSVLGSSGIDYDGKASAGDGGDNTNAASGFFWNQFSTLEIAKVLNAKTDDEFDAAWKEVYDKFVKEGNYEAAKQDMTKWFETYGPEQ